MADYKFVLDQISSGAYTLSPRRKGKSFVWNILTEVLKEDGSIVEDLVYCRSCKKILKSVGNPSSNLIRHKCCQALKHPNTLQPVSISDKTETLNVLSKWFVEDCHPFSSVTEVGFKKLVKSFLKIGAKYGECVNLDDMLPDDATVACKCQKYDDKKRAEERVMNEIDCDELIRVVYSRSDLWDQGIKNHYNSVLSEENWQIVSQILKQPKGLCKKKWQITSEQFRSELKKIPLALLQTPELTKEQYEPYTSWPYFKSLLFLKNHMMTRTPEGYYNIADEIPDTSNEVNFDESFSESDEYISDLDEPQSANEQPKMELMKNEFTTQKPERDDDNAFFDSLMPYMKTMDIHQKMLCRMDIQRTVYNYSFPADSTMPEPAQNSIIQMDSYVEDSKMNIVDITREPKDLQN